MSAGRFQPWFLLSKPLRAPFADGTSVLARTLVESLPPERSVVYLGDPEQPVRSSGLDRILRAQAMPHAPGIWHKAKAVLPPFLPENWRVPLHVFFAPNPRSSRILAALASVAPRRPIIQTVTASDDLEVSLKWLHAMDHLIVHSRHTQARLVAAGYASERITCLYPAVQPAASAALQTVSSERQAASESPPNLLFAGDLDEHVVARLVAIGQALRSVPAEFGKMIVAARPKAEGDARWRAVLHEGLAPLISRQKAEIHGQIADFARTMATSAIALFVSDHVRRKVDLPLVVLEGLARGQAVLASEARPIGEIFECAASCNLEIGESVPAHASPERWGQAALSMLAAKNRWEIWRQNGPKLVERCFSPKVMVDGYLRLWDRFGELRP
jgi:hypothetical protein